MCIFVGTINYHTPKAPSPLGSRATASADLEQPPGSPLALGLDMGSCWSGPMCTAAIVHNLALLARFLPRPSCTWGSRYFWCVIPATMVYINICAVTPLGVWYTPCPGDVCMEWMVCGQEYFVTRVDTPGEGVMYNVPDGMH